MGDFQIKSLEIKSFRGFDLQVSIPERHPLTRERHLLIQGPESSGKTTLLAGLWLLLGEFWRRSYSETLFPLARTDWNDESYVKMTFEHEEEVSTLRMDFVNGEASRFITPLWHYQAPRFWFQTTKLQDLGWSSSLSYSSADWGGDESSLPSLMNALRRFIFWAPHFPDWKTWAGHPPPDTVQRACVHPKYLQILEDYFRAKVKIEWEQDWPALFVEGKPTTVSWFSQRERNAFNFLTHLCSLVAESEQEQIVVVDDFFFHIGERMASAINNHMKNIMLWVTHSNAPVEMLDESMDSFSRNPFASRHLDRRAAV